MGLVEYKKYEQIFAQRALDGKTLPQVCRELQIHDSGARVWLRRNMLDCALKFKENGLRRRNQQGYCTYQGKDMTTTTTFEVLYIVCRQCKGQPQPVSAFYKNKQGRLRQPCKRCASADAARRQREKRGERKAQKEGRQGVHRPCKI